MANNESHVLDILISVSLSLATKKRGHKRETATEIISTENDRDTKHPQQN